MRRLFLLFGFFFFFFSHSYSQSFFGIKSSYDLTANFLQSTSNQIYYPNVSGGVVYKYSKIPNWWFMQLEVNYVHKELEYTYSEFDSFGAGYYVENIQSQNIHVNFLSHVQLGKSQFKFGFHAGPFVSYMFDAKRSVRDSISVLDVVSPPMISNLDYGITVGTSFVYSFEASELQLDANFSTSYSSLTTSLEEQSFDYRNNQLIQISLAYFFSPTKYRKNKERISINKELEQ